MPTGIPLTPLERALRDIERAVNQLLNTSSGVAEERRSLTDQLAKVQAALAPQKGDAE